MALHPTFAEHTINQFCLLLNNGQINLGPGFQCKSVWTENDGTDYRSGTSFGLTESRVSRRLYRSDDAWQE